MAYFLSNVCCFSCIHDLDVKNNNNQKNPFKNEKCQNNPLFDTACRYNKKNYFQTEMVKNPFGI